MYLFTSSLLPLLALVNSAAAHGTANARYHRGLVGRAGAPISNDTLDAISSSMDIWSSEHQTSTPATSATPTSSPVQSETQETSAVETPVVVSTSSAAAQPSVVPVSSTEQVEQPETSAAAISSAVVASPSPTPSVQSTLSNVQAVTSTVVRGSTSRVSLVTTTRTDTSSASSTAGSANAEKGSEKIAGLPQTTFIIIVVVASVVALIGIGWTLFRKWKLRPSNRFDERMKPIDFSPHNDGLNDDFLEKTLHRSNSNSSVDRQRQQFSADLDEPHPNHVAGIPDHDFTATNQAGYGAYNADMYNNDPFAHASAYDYDQEYYNQHAYPPATHAQVHGSGAGYDHPTQDSEEGYANLQRGNSTGSGGHSNHGQQQVYPTDFPSPEAYLGRPTHGQDGPYAQASQYRY